MVRNDQQALAETASSFSFEISSFVSVGNQVAVLLVTCLVIPSLSDQSEPAKNTIHC